ncbi:MAG: VCBS repeat-containing protein [Planctomycetota bacterium]
MTSGALRGLAIVLLVQALPAQQLLWQVPPMPPPPSTVQYFTLAPFPDYNRDRYLDYLQVVAPNAFVTSQAAVQIVSGRDASILWSIPNGGRVVHAGDIDGDGEPDIAIVKGSYTYRWVEIWSPKTNTILWQQVGGGSNNYGHAMLGDIDVNGDGRSDFLVATSEPWSSDVFVYDSSGIQLYTVPCLSQGRQAFSLCGMGDMNADGRDDFLIGCQDPLGRGVLVLTSGLDGSVMRLSYGLATGDLMTDHATNLGDIDGDGVNDYAGFPHISSWSGLCMQFSGATGNIIRYWYDFADSVIAGQDMGLDGVPDLVLGADLLVSGSVYGTTRALSGRDGTLLWRVDNFVPPPGSGYSNGSSGWARYAAGLGVQPGSFYPAIAWMDLEWFASNTPHGRVRTYNTARAGQGPITGRPCSSTNQLPQIGARQTASGARVTIAKAPPGAVAFLNLAAAPQTTYAGLPLPIDLSSLGFIGCYLHVGPEASAWRILGTTGIDRGYAAVDLPFGLSAAATGHTIVAQWLVLDPATLAYATTSRHQLRGP